MTTVQTPFSFPILSSSSGALSSKRNGLELRILSPTSCCSPQRRKIGVLLRNGLNMKCPADGFPFLGEGSKKARILMRKGRKESLVIVRAFDFNKGGGGWDKNSTSRVLGNLGLAVGLTYLTMTGQLGWVLDAIVSIWLLAVALPIIGLVAFFWFAGRDIVQSSCPNCGNNFQIFKSSLKDGLQLCPFCTQPFSVQGNKFVKESERFSSSRPTTSGQVFNGFSPRFEKGEASSATIVDIEAEVKDID